MMTDGKVLYLIRVSGVLLSHFLRSPNHGVGYLIKSDSSWGFACTLAVSYNTSSNAVYGVCIGLNDSKARSWTKLLLRERRCAGNPLFLPTTFSWLYIRTTININRRHSKDFYDIQISMETDDYIQSPKIKTAPDLVKFTRKLTSLSTSSVGVTQLCSTQDRIVQFLWEQFEFLKRENPTSDDVLTTLWESLAFTREILRAERQHNEYIKAAAQAQVQMVCAQILCFASLLKMSRCILSQPNEIVRIV